VIAGRVELKDGGVVNQTEIAAAVAIGSLKMSSHSPERALRSDMEATRGKKFPQLADRTNPSKAAGTP
jgi:hypothetical protein